MHHVLNLVLGTAEPVAPLPTPATRGLLCQLALLLAVALPLGRLARRLRLSALVGELLAGIVLGPSILGHLNPTWQRALFPPQPEQAHLYDALSQFGIIMLVGLTAARLDLDTLHRRRADIGRTLLGALLAPLMAGIILGSVLPTALSANAARPTTAVFVGAALTATAIPVLGRTLAELDLLRRDIGQLTLAAAACTNIAAWLLLSVIPSNAASVDGYMVASSLIKIVATLITAHLIGRPLALCGTRWAGNHTGATTSFAATITLLYGAIASCLGLEAAYGAMLAGATVLCRLPRERLAGLQQVALTVLAPIVLAGAGLRVDLAVLTSPPTLSMAVIAIAVAFVSKFCGSYAGARLSKIPRSAATVVAVGLNTRGMVGVTVALVGLRQGVLNTLSFTILVFIALVSSAAASPLMRVSSAGGTDLTTDSRPSDADADRSPTIEVAPEPATSSTPEPATKEL